ncbi:unnamed protein product [Pleuronectes platessa]|uniref:Uncharacterized protein n=1 Tax=Pleuronectes platessa TaxID=8262 RepID=A0A9N7UY02_PLEPL|nr:unnamed protein product [Pleuronectes platessa]
MTAAFSSGGFTSSILQPLRHRAEELLSANEHSAMLPHHGEWEVVGARGGGGLSKEARKKDRKKEGHKKRGPLGPLAGRRH